jgi:alginate O-acetyltransferase complex protein AlgJ
MHSTHPAVARNWLLISGFFVALWLPILQRPGQYPSCFYENGPAGLTLHGPTEIEKRVLDRYPRKNLLTTHNQLRLRLFGLLPRTVIQGYDGWLFYRSESAHDGDTMDDYLGRSTPDERTLMRWETLIKDRGAWCAAANAMYLLVVAPNKQSIYPEHLPSFHRRRPDSPPNRLDLLAALGSPENHFVFLDLREHLLRAKERESVYYLTDSHWNDAGALAADLAIVTRLQRRFPELQPLSRDDFRSQITKLSGDIAALTNAASQHNESAIRLVPLHDHFARTFDGQLLLNVNHAPNCPTPETKTGVDIVAIENPNAPDLRAVVFHDSFGLGVMPFLAQHFRSATFVRQRFDAAIVDALHPHLVIDLVAERYLERAIPVAPMASRPTP